MSVLNKNIPLMVTVSEVIYLKNKTKNNCKH